MLVALLDGGGLQGVAQVAAEGLNGSVGIIVYSTSTAVTSDDGDVDVLLRMAAQDPTVGAPLIAGGVGAEVPIEWDGEVIGRVVLLPHGAPAPADATEYLRLAAAITLVEVALHDAREDAEQRLRGALLEELISSGDEVNIADVVRRARRLGCDLTQGVVVLCVEPASDSVHRAVFAVKREWTSALVERVERPGKPVNVTALLPPGPKESVEVIAGRARTLAARLQRYGPVGVSSFCHDMSRLGAALAEAQVVLDVMRHSDLAIADAMNGGIYPLLFQMLATHPEQVRSYCDETIGALLVHDAKHGGDLVGTLEAYLAQNCNMNATATAVYAHRHTVAHRLERIRALTRLDPTKSEDRDRLTLALKVRRLIGPHMPR